MRNLRRAEGRENLMRRPTSVTVFAIINFVFAGFGFLGLLTSVALFMTKAAQNNPVYEAMARSPMFRVYNIVMMPIGLIVCIVLVLSGIGLLLLKRWGRTITMVYAVYAMVQSVVGTIMTFVFVLPALRQAAGGSGSSGAAATGAAIGTVVGAMFGLLVGLLYPILLLVFMTRPNVKAAFGVDAAI